MSVLLCNSILCGHTATAAPNTNNSDQIEGVPPANERIKLKITDLNLDVMYIIFENIFVYDLTYTLNMMKTIPEFSPLIMGTFRTNFRNIKIANMYGRDHDCDPSLKTLTLTDIDLIEKTFETFGPIIQRIRVEFLLFDEMGNTGYRTRISQAINKYAKSVKHLEFDRPNEDIFQHFTQPLDELEELQLFITKTLQNGSLPLNELFPKLRQLDLSMLYFRGQYSIFDCEFAHLEHLILNFDESAWGHRNQIKSFLRKNAHVKSVHLGSMPKGFLNELPELLPNIENLTLNTVYIDSDYLRMESVKHVTFYSHMMYTNGPTDKLSFPRLESVECFYDSNAFSTFFNKHTNLTHLYLKSSDVNFDSTVADVVTKFPNLIEIKVDHYVPLNIENIQRIIDSQSGLMKVQFSTVRYLQEQLEVIRQRFSNVWNIRHLKTTIYSESLLFERKH